MEQSKDTNVKTTIDAITGLVQAVPIYQDTLQPAAKQVGKSLETVAKTVNIALAPIKALVWGYEKIEEFISTRVSEKLKNVPEQNIKTPPPEVAGPAIEALRFSGHDINLRELYANLIATSMDISTVHHAHPGFVEVLKNMTSDEAILIKAFLYREIFPLIDIRAKLKDETGFSVKYQNYSHFHKTVKLNRPDLIPAYLNNLCRLGILEIPALVTITTENIYEPLENDQELDDAKFKIESEMGRVVGFGRKTISLTTFGKQFVQNVVKEKGEIVPAAPQSPQL